MFGGRVVVLHAGETVVLAFGGLERMELVFVEGQGDGEGLCGGGCGLGKRGRILSGRLGGEGFGYDKLGGLLLRELVLYGGGQLVGFYRGVARGIRWE